MAGYLEGDFGNRLVVSLASVTGHVPVYSTVQVWIGTGVLLGVVGAILALVGWAIQRGRTTARRPRRRAHRHP